jgi:hypothetical protein
LQYQLNGQSLWRVQTFWQLGPAPEPSLMQALPAAHDDGEHLPWDGVLDDEQLPAQSRIAVDASATAALRRSTRSRRSSTRVHAPAPAQQKTTNLRAQRRMTANKVLQGP